MDAEHLPSDPAPTPADRTCVNCGQVVRRDRKRFCDHCGLPFDTVAGGQPRTGEPTAAEAAAANLEVGLRARVILVVVLVVGWLAPVVISRVAPEDGDGGLTLTTIVLVGALCAYSGAVAWVVAPRHRKLRYGALPGILLIVGLVVVGVVIPLLTGTLAETAPEGETPFSILIELPFWIGVVAVWTIPPGIVGWLLARAAGTAWARRHAR